jgi:hypothetical protein
VNKLARDETSCPLTKENVKGHCPGVVAIMGMSLMLLSYDRGRLAHYETPYSLWIYIYIYIYIFLFFKLSFPKKKTIILVWYPNDDNATH